MAFEGYISTDPYAPAGYHAPRPPDPVVLNPYDYSTDEGPPPAPAPAPGVGTTAGEQPRYGGVTGAAGAGAGAAGTSFAPGSMDWIRDQLSRVNSTDDPNYWFGVIGKDPKVAAGDQSAINYWIDRIRRGDGSALVKSGQLSRVQDGGGSGGYGFGGGLSGQFSVPTLQDALAMPGLQFTIDRARDAVMKSAAAKGVLNTGGTLRDLADYTTNVALSQGYLPLSQLALGGFNANVNANMANQNALQGWARIGQTGTATGMGF